MIPIKQTKFGDEGTCVQACIASIFDVPLNDVPDFNQNPKGWYHTLQLWTMETFGLYPVTLRVGEGHTAITEGYYCVSGISHRGYRHMCVGLAGKIVHDPHPDDTGLAEYEEIMVFAKAMK